MSAEQTSDQTAVQPHTPPHGCGTWNEYWTKAHKQPWRTEPEIDDERKRYLAERRAIIPDHERGIYPFRNEAGSIKLRRADIEWLLATHRGGRGPLDWSGEKQRLGLGLDLRGADLRQVDLRGLPLSGLVAGSDSGEWVEYTLAAREAAAAHFENAILVGAHLEDAILGGAYLQGAWLFYAHFERARLVGAHIEVDDNLSRSVGQNIQNRIHFEGADLREVHCEGAWLRGSFMEGADLSHAHLDKCTLEEAHLVGASLYKASLQDVNLAGSRLSGADLREANLAGTNLFQVQLYGSDISENDRKRIGGNLSSSEVRDRWPNGVLPATVPAADLRGAFFSAATNLQSADLTSAEYGTVLVADVRWGDVNLAVVDWTQTQPGLLRLRRRLEAIELGDEREAKQTKDKDGKPKDKPSRLQAYQGAVRANRQLATALRQQGLNEDADRFAYRAQKLQRQVLRRQRRYGSALGSWFLDLIAGYGYKPMRSLIAYILIICTFSGAYLLNAQFAAPHLTWDEALVLSVSAFHGRGFFTTGISLGDTLARLAAVEAIIGLLIEITFIATFTQRFFAR